MAFPTHSSHLNKYNNEKTSTWVRNFGKVKFGDVVPNDTVLSALENSSKVGRSLLQKHPLGTPFFFFFFNLK